MASITHKRTDKDGKDVWLLRVFVDGKQVGRIFTGTRKQAQFEAARLEMARQSGDLVKQSKRTVTEYMNEWLETYHRPEVSKVTYSSDCSRIKLHITPTLGGKRLDALHTMDCQRLINGIASKGHKRTAVMIYGLMSKALRQAKRLGMIAKNPMDDVVKPKDRAAERPFFSTEQAIILLRAAHGDRYYALIAFLVMSGVRPEEAFGLRWEDVDLASRTVSIVRSMKRLAGGGWEFGELKTLKSRRQLDIGGQLVAILSDHKKQQNRDRLILGQRWQNNNLVFCNEVGGPVDDSSLRKHLKKILSEAGLPQIWLYDLRHTHGSMLLEQGTHIKVIADRLGHANPTMTVNRYLHVAASVSRQAVDTLDAALAPKTVDEKAESQ